MLAGKEERTRSKERAVVKAKTLQGSGRGPLVAGEATARIERAEGTAQCQEFCGCPSARPPGADVLVHRSGPGPHTDLGVAA